MAGRPETHARIVPALDGISDVKFTPYAELSEKRSDSKEKVLSYFKKFTNIITGGDFVPMLKSYFKSNEGEPHRQRLAHELSSTPLKKLQENQRDAVNNATDPNVRRALLGPVCHLSLATLRSQGYRSVDNRPLGERELRSAREAWNANGPGRPELPERKRGGCPRLMDRPGKRQAMEDFLIKNSEVCSSLVSEVTCLLKAEADGLDEVALTRCLTAPPTALAAKNPVCKSTTTFFKILRKDFQNFLFSRRYTDLCKFCNKYRLLLLHEPRLLLLLLERAKDLQPDEKTKPTSVRGLLQQSTRFQLKVVDKTTARQFMIQIEWLEHHRGIARRQRGSHENGITVLYTSITVFSLHVTRDRAQPFDIGIGGREGCGVFHNMSHALVEVFVVHLSGTECMYFTEISDVLEHNSLISCFTLDRVLDKVRALHPQLVQRCSHFSIWSDAASDYLSHECSWFNLYFLVDKHKVEVIQSFFGKKHAKGEHDREIARQKLIYKIWLHHASKGRAVGNDKRCKSYLELGNILEAGHTEQNATRAAKGEATVERIVGTYKQADIQNFAKRMREQHGGMHALRIKDIQQTYCLKRGPNDETVKNAQFSDSAFSMKVNVKPTNIHDTANETRQYRISEKKTPPEARLSKLGKGLKIANDFAKKAGDPDFADFHFDGFDPDPDIIKYKMKCNKADFRLFAVVRKRLMYFQDKEDSFWRFGVIMSVSADKETCIVCLPRFENSEDVRKVPVSELCDDAGARTPTVYFLRNDPALSDPILSCNVDEESWARCDLCSKWRIVSSSKLHEIPEDGSFVCIGGCHSEQSEKEYRVNSTE